MNGFIKNPHYNDIPIISCNNFVINGLTVSQNNLTLFHFYFLKYFCFDSLIKLFHLLLIFLVKNISSRRSFGVFISNSRFSIITYCVSYHHQKKNTLTLFHRLQKLTQHLQFKFIKCGAITFARSIQIVLASPR